MTPAPERYVVELAEVADPMFPARPAAIRLQQFLKAALPSARLTMHGPEGHGSSELALWLNAAQDCHEIIEGVTGRPP